MLPLSWEQPLKELSWWCIYIIECLCVDQVWDQQGSPFCQRFPAWLLSNSFNLCVLQSCKQNEKLLFSCSSSVLPQLRAKAVTESKDSGDTVKGLTEPVTRRDLPYKQQCCCQWICVSTSLKVKEIGIVIYSPSYPLKASQPGERSICKKIIYLGNYTTWGKGIQAPEWV